MDDKSKTRNEDARDRTGHLDPAAPRGLSPALADRARQRELDKEQAKKDNPDNLTQAERDIERERAKDPAELEKAMRDRVWPAPGERDPGHILREAAAKAERDRAAMVESERRDLQARTREEIFTQPEEARRRDAERIEVSNPVGYLAVNPRGDVVAVPRAFVLKPGWAWATASDQERAKRDAEQRKETGERIARERADAAARGVPYPAGPAITYQTPPTPSQRQATPADPTPPRARGKGD